jgi:hypothetical protein
MPSRLPGMNPYLEQADNWADFHTEFLTGLRHQLDPRIGPDYIVQLEKHVYIHELPPEPRRFLDRPDVSVVRSATSTAGAPNLGVLEAPVEIQLPELDVERVVFLEIRDRHGREHATGVNTSRSSNS